MRPCRSVPFPSTLVSMLVRPRSSAWLATWLIAGWWEAPAGPTPQQRRAAKRARGRPGTHRPDRSGHRPACPNISDVDAFSELTHVVAGHTYAEIAQSLFISEKTVSTHVSHLLRRTGTHRDGRSRHSPYASSTGTPRTDLVPQRQVTQLGPRAASIFDISRAPHGIDPASRRVPRRHVRTSSSAAGR